MTSCRLTSNKDYRMKNELMNDWRTRQQSCRILVDKPLLDYLRTKCDGKFSKLDAFCYLLDKAVAAPAHQRCDDASTDVATVRTLHPFEVTVTDLAKSWNWHRATTRKFLAELAEMRLLTKEPLQKSCIITMRLSVTDSTEEGPSAPQAPDHRIAAFICGNLPLDEACHLFGQLTACNGVSASGRLVGRTDLTAPMPYGIIHRMMLWHLYDLSSASHADNEVVSILHELYTNHHNGEWSTMLARLTDLSAILHGEILPSRHPAFDGIPGEEAALLDRMYRYYHHLVSPDKE